MTKVLERSSSVHSEHLNSHKKPSRLIRRRSILGGIAALFGASACPKATGLPSIIEAITPAAGGIADRISAPAVFWLNGFRSGPALDRILPSAEHAEAYRLFADHRDDNAILPPRDEHSVGTVEIDFHAGTRAFMAIETDIDVDGWLPAHSLDVPQGAASELEWSGAVTAGEYLVDPTEFVTRGEALAKAAAENQPTYDDHDGDALECGERWWIVVQFSTIFDTSRISIDLCGNVGKAAIHVDLAVRVVAPTAAEIRRHVKGGAL